jgi:ribosomal protein S18 acetylase RimI-like enzyme
LNALLSTSLKSAANRWLGSHPTWQPLQQVTLHVAQNNPHRERVDNSIAAIAFYQLPIGRIERV